MAGFDVIGELGRGAHSVVHRVRRAGSPDGTAAPEYALKVQDLPGGRTEDALVAFRREAALLASVDHPGLPRIHEVGETGGRPYLVMDLVDGAPLGELLRAGPLPLAQVLRIAVDIAGPIAAVHAKGLVHRDLKPDNVIVSSRGVARLIDFGLAARENSNGRTPENGPSAVGTLAYSPPEQTGMLKRPVDGRSDLYSVGVLLFECLAGRLPFLSQDVGELLRMHAVTPAPDLREEVPEVPAEFARIIAKLLAKDPDDRYQDGVALERELRAFAGTQQGSGLAAPGEPDPGHHPGGRAPRPLPGLAGRERELAQLARRWQQAAEGRGGAAVIRGSGGAGKSRLALEVAGRAALDGAVVMHGKSSPDDPVPLAPLRTAVNDHLAALATRPEPEREAALQVLREAAGPMTGLLAGLTPQLAEALGAGAGGGPGTEADQQEQYALAVASFLAAVARASDGLLILLDDAQWLDAGSRRVLAALVPELASAPLLVVATARNDDASAEATDAVVAALGGTVDPDLVLGPLDQAGVAAMVSAQLPGIDATSRLARLIAVRGNGNPFVVQEYLRAVVDAGLLRPSWGTWLLDEDGLDALELPQDAIGLVLSRARGLRLRTRDLLGTAAAIGARFDATTLAHVHGIEREVALGALAEATGHRLIEAREGRVFGFLHDRIREALLEDVPAEQRPARHQRIAQALQQRASTDAEDVYAVAHHYVLGDGSRPQDTFAACRAAGALALENHAPGEAADFLEHAARIGPPEPDADFSLVLGTALKGTGRFSEAATHLNEALTAESDPLRRAGILTLLADVHRSTWSTDDARAAVEEGLAVLGAPLPRTRAMKVLSTLAMFALALLMQTTRIGFGSARGAQADRIRAIAALHEVGSYVGVISIRTDSVLLHNLRVVFWVNRLGGGRQYVLSQGTFGFVCGNIGRLRAALRALARAKADPASRPPQVAAMVAHYEGAAYYLGHHDGGQRWTQLIEEHGRWLELAAYADAVSTLHLEAIAAGRTAEAGGLLAAGQHRLATSRSEKTSLFVSEALTLAQQGRLGEARTALERAQRLVAGDHVLGLTSLRLITTVHVLAEQDDLGPAFEAAVQEFEALGMHPAFMIRSQRMVHFDIALVRLRQLRRSQPAERPERLAAARAAVRLLRKARANPTLRARELIARADLQVLEGAPERALRTLGGLPDVAVPDSPALAHEAALVRARAVGALEGGREESLRHATLAVSIAEQQGWSHRVRRVGAEFGLAGAGRATQALASQSRGPLTTTGGGLEKQRLRALEQVSAAASRVLDPGALVRITLDKTIRILAADRAFLFLVLEDRLVPNLGRDAAGQDLARLTGYSASLVERVRATGRPLVVTGTEEGAALGAQSVVLHGLRSVLVAPLMLEGRVLGVIYLDSQVAKGIFTEQDAGILTALTNHIATSLETARAAQLEISMRTAERERDLAQKLGRALAEMTEALDPPAVLRRLLSAAGTLLTGQDAWLLRRDGDTCTLLHAPGSGTPDGGPSDDGVLACDPLTQAFLRNPRPVTSLDGPPPPVLRAPLRRARSWVAVPLRSRSADLGFLVVATADPQVRLEQEVEVAVALATQGMTAYDKAMLYAQVKELAVADELTGIANRRRFFEVAERDVAKAQRSGQQLLAMMIDIDSFKRVNDTYGHQTGDDVIRTVAARLGSQLRATDLLGRYGGEEFALVVPDAAADLPLAERLRACIADTQISTRSGRLDVTVSVGTARLSGGDDLSGLLARADQALYRAKHTGRNRVCEDADPPPEPAPAG